MRNPQDSNANQERTPSADNVDGVAPRLVNRSDASTKSKRGIALISVLTVVTLATILVLTFFTLARNELVASVNYSDGLHAKALSETAINMVIGQIRRATEPQSNVPQAWASQPGAIRTYNGLTGVFQNGYKLYSSAAMVETGAGSAGENSLVNTDFAALGTWSSQLWKYVDLNEPVIRGDRIYYPIVDPRARDYPEWDDAREFDDAGVEGFDWNLTGIAQSPMQDALQEITDPLTGRKHTALPMPVEWIYQLEDGTFGTLDNSLTFTATGGGGGAAPSKQNPIIGRIAFWTDDESSKSNVNVHAGGTAWDTPRAGGDIDRNLGRYQPAQHEWQRYKGHPATTSLAPVLFPGMKNITLNRDEMEKIFKLVPRIVGGGSASGTRAVNPNDPLESNGLIADKDRLYPSLDDFILRPGGERGDNHTDPNITFGPRLENDFPQLSGGQTENELMELTRFFLTVSSRSPEVNLFNMPRVSIWPTYYAKTSNEEQYHKTNFDRFIRYCAELGETGGERHQYYFQRKNADSATSDWDDIPRNKAVYGYLDNLMAKQIPGYGASFRDKYGKDNCRQLLTQMFDYIRSSNLFDDSIYDEAIPDNPNSWRGAYKKVNSAGHFSFTNYRTESERGLHMGHGQVTPLKVTYDGSSTMGFGRFYTLEEAAIQLICCADGGDGSPGGVRVGPISETMNVETVGNGDSYYGNFPPLHQSVQQGDENTWPGWVKTLKTTNADLAAKAVDPMHWNWMLAKANGIMDYDRTKLPAATAATWAQQPLKLAADERLVQAVFLMEMYCPAAGWTSINPDMMINVNFNGLNIEGNIFEPDPNSIKYSAGVDNPGNLWVCNRHNFSAVWGGRNYGGGGGFRSLMRGTLGPDVNEGDVLGSYGVYNTDDRERGHMHPDGAHGWHSGRRAVFDGRVTAGSKIDSTNIYPFVTRPFKVSADTVALATGTPVEVSFYANRQENPDSGKANASETTTFTSAPQAGPELVQTIELDFSKFGGSMPTPSLSGGTPELVNEFKAIYSGETTPMQWWSAGFDGANPYSAGNGRLARSPRTIGGTSSNERNSGVGRFIRTGDTVWSMAVLHGDSRTVACLPLVEADGTTKFEPHPNAGGTEQLAHALTLAVGGLARFEGISGTNITDLKYPGGKAPLPIAGGESVRDTHQIYGDFDNGMGGTIDGAYINKVDEGNTHSLRKRTVTQAEGSWEWRRDYGSFPYFVREWTHEPSGPAFFSPNRMMPSPVVFGSMPNMIYDNEDSPTEGAWQTMLFRPNVVGGDYENHPGAVSPPDHMLLDLFWMPVVEPYAISEPSSTAGRVNMNYQILPFKNITRTSALRGVFQSEYMLCIPNYHVKNYKSGVGRGNGYHWLYRPFDGELQRLSLRSVIVEDDTLAQFETKFNANEIFLTASEICDIHLIPQDIGEKQGFANKTGTYKPKLSDMENGRYWTDHKLVGDNGRESPYAHIYPRLTTKSNTFRVHVRSQVLKKARDSQPDVWNPTLDTVVAEYRGSALVERYIEPNDPAIPDYTLLDGSPTLDVFYKFRVINEKRFSP